MLTAPLPLQKQIPDYPKQYAVLESEEASIKQSRKDRRVNLKKKR